MQLPQTNMSLLAVNSILASQLVCRCLRQMNDTPHRYIHLPCKPSRVKIYSSMHSFFTYGEWQRKSRHFEMTIKVNYPVLDAHADEDYTKLRVKVNHSYLGEQTATTSFPKLPNDTDVYVYSIIINHDEVVIEAHCRNVEPLEIEEECSYKGDGGVKEPFLLVIEKPRTLCERIQIMLGLKK